MSPALSPASPRVGHGIGGGVLHHLQFLCGEGGRTGSYEPEGGHRHEQTQRRQPL